MRVGMALPKTVGYVIVVLVIYYGLENQGYIKSLKVFFEAVIQPPPEDCSVNVRSSLVGHVTSVKATAHAPIPPLKPVAA
ncbi:hypothetical protein PAMP_013893 [Pampus punctatissimus]